MSEFLLCKGQISQLGILGVKIHKYPFSSFFNEICDYLWNGEIKSDIWTIDVEGYSEIDCCFTEAQEQIINGADYSETKIYLLITELLKCNIEIVFWYSEFFENIPYVNSKKDLFKRVYEGITDKNGMCEVYARYKARLN